MSIRKLDRLHAQLSIESYQADGHECGMKGIAELRGRTLPTFRRTHTTRMMGMG